MKKVFVLLLFLLSQVAMAQTIWTVQTVPNTRLQSNLIHVSDPDGYISDSAEHFINMALDSIRDQADVFLVTLTSIGDDEPKHFATRLFNNWGIGDAETNNGVLLLFVEDQHALEFETGYGAEAILTDAHCAKIFNNTIVPYFREGDYEGGLCAGVIDIVEVYGGVVPDGLMSQVVGHGNYGDDTEDDGEDAMSGFGAMFLLFFLMPVPLISFFRWVFGFLAKKKEDVVLDGFEAKQKEGINYFDSPSLSMDTTVWKKKGFLRFLLYGVGLVVIYVLAVYYVPDFFPDASPVAQNDWVTGITLFAYLSLVCVVQNRMELKKADALAEESKIPKAIYKRAKGDAHSVLTRVMAPWLGVFYGLAFKKRIKDSVYCCPTCGQPMEPSDPFSLPKIWNLEQELSVYSLSYYRCASGHLFIERSKGSQYKNYINCKHCGAHAVKQMSENVITAATYSHSGTKEVTYSCKCCNETYTETKIIPKLVYTSSSSSSSHSRSYSSHSHGSFGGGRSGGGGFSGRW